MIPVIIMAGGKGSRMNYAEKALIKICNKTMLERVLNSVKDLSMNNIYITVTNHTPRTKKYCIKNRLEYIETSGNGFIEDAREAMNKINTTLSLVICCDLPFITSFTLKEFIEAWKRSNKKAAAVYTTQIYLRNMSIKSEYEGDYVPVGINIMPNGKEYHEEYKHVIEKIDVLNVNTEYELKLARRICKSIQKQNFYHLSKLFLV